MRVHRAWPILVVSLPLVIGAACGSSGSKPSVAAYCAKAGALEGAADKLGSVDVSDKAAVKSTLLSAQADAHSALKLAPAAIHADAATRVRDIDDLVNVVAKAGYDVTKVNSQDVDRISTQGVDAQTRVKDFNQKTCGLLLPASTTVAPGQPATTVTTGVGSG